MSREAFVDALVARTLEPYRSMGLPPEVLEEMELMLQLVAEAGPGAMLVDRARPRTAPEASGAKVREDAPSVDDLNRTGTSEGDR